MGLDQIGIALCGVVAVWLTQDQRERWRRWACIFGILGQPFWFYAAWRAEQWGILALCMLYTYAWARGLWIHWAGQRRLGCVVKDLDGQPQNSVETIRYPAVKGPPKTATVLNNSMLHIGLMRRSIKLTGIHIQDSKHAAWESQQLLARLRRDGF